MMNKVMNFKMIILASSAALLGLSACSDTKQSLGLTKKSPDEFKVIKRAPLAMPPEYSLRPPRAGAPRPQEQKTSETARQAIFGEETQEQKYTTSSAEEILLQESGSAGADPDIRSKIDQELQASEDDGQPIGTKLFGVGGNSKADADVVDAKAEIQRLHGGDMSVTAPASDNAKGKE